MTVVEAIERAARLHADRTALVELDAELDGERARVTYQQLHDRVLRACAAFERDGIGRGSRVAVLLDNSIDMVVTEWACLLGGYLWVALNVRSSRDELSAILADAEPSVLVAGERHATLGAQLCEETACRLLVAGRARGAGDCWQTFVSSAPADGPARFTAAADPVRIRYTSGTAGRPKGAVLSRECYDASLETVAGVIGPVEPADVLLQVAPMTHASGAMLLPHVVVGARAVLATRFDAVAFPDLVDRVGVTAAFLVPTMLVRLIERLEQLREQDPRRAASVCRTLRTIVYGGASIPVDRLVRALALLGPVLVQIYGMTESTWPITALAREDHLRRDGESEAAWHARLASCGSPTPVGEVRIVDGAGREVAAGQAGEIHVRGRNTMVGYWHRDVAGVRSDDNREVLDVDGKGLDADGKGLDVDRKGLDAEGWMHTGDVGRRDVDGNVTIVDRLHDMIVSGGFNIYPREVEDVLSAHPAVLESAVVGRPSEEWGEAVHAFVVLRDGARVSVDELVTHCAARLTGYKKPRSIDLVEALPKNAAGKILRRELRAALEPR